MAGNSVPVVIKLTAIDEVTAKLAGMNAKLAKITAPAMKTQMAFRGVGGEISKAFKMIGAGPAIESLSNIGSKGKDFLGDVVGAATKAGLAIAGAGASLFALAHSFANTGDNIKNVSERLGISTDAFQELAYAALQADVSQEDFTAAMTRLQKGMVETRMGTGEAMNAFNALGIEMNKADGSAKKSDQVFSEFADGIAGVKDESLRTALVMKVFGKSGGPLVTMLAEGSAGIEKFRKEAKRIGAVIPEDEIKIAAQFDGALKGIIATFTGIKNVIGAAVAPALLALGKSLQEYIIKYTPEIRAFAKSFAESLPGAIDKSIELFKSLWASLQPVISVLKTIIDYVGAFNVALIAVVAYIIGPAVASFLSFAGAIIGPAVGALVSFIGMIATGTPFMAAFNAVLLANPIGLIIAGVALLGTAFTLLYNNVEPFKKLIDGLWESTKSFFSWFGGPHGSTMPKIPAMPAGNFGLDMGINTPVATCERRLATI